MTKQQLNRPATVVGADHNFSVHIDAAPELVFEAWKNPIQLSQWWAPGNFVTSVAEWDVRPGGNIRIYVKAADGNEHLHQGKFLEVLFPEKLVLVLQKDGPGLDKQHDHTLVVNIA